MLDKNKITEKMWVEAYEDMKIRKKMVQAQCESCWTNNAELGLVALKTQVPVEVTDIHVDEFFCPVCGSEIPHDIDDVKPNYCEVCGQRLKWYLDRK